MSSRADVPLPWAATGVTDHLVQALVPRSIAASPSANYGRDVWQQLRRRAGASLPRETRCTDLSREVNLISTRSFDSAANYH